MLAVPGMYCITTIYNKGEYMHAAEVHIVRFNMHYEPYQFADAIVAHLNHPGRIIYRFAYITQYSVTYNIQFTQCRMLAPSGANECV